jgi:hypothetical protein
MSDVLRTVASIWMLAGVVTAALAQMSLSSRVADIVALTRVLGEPWGGIIGLSGLGQGHDVLVYLVGVAVNSLILLSIGNQIRAKH